ncbi:adenylate/guanylate cyclase domain-containing protein [Rhodococcus sp. D2-41]|uniref:HAMP domain-containing protein n=1 Tax=Speluncibacter jeojiensis TaxID=2710754 RepID=A0A9X4M6V9_9ACTN|nr:adenylate/guanylate cyclase domain-containing protein [Rhodococcus sp. D2-41]MDG3009363.1 adenylate/guanylate cyclase domain-containing protein [Rhodococcus sp. D2-41]MDG3017082.1 HAMP domain-containing protein [Corynebacteriales bacterium D3-21]
MKTARWLFSTPWPMYVAGMVQANLVGALFLFLFLRYGLSVRDVIDMQHVALLNQGLFAAYLIISVIVDALVALKLIYPVLMWQRHGGTGPRAAAARVRALRMPALQAYVHVGMWLVGGVIFVVVNLRTSGVLAFAIAVAVALGAAMTTSIGYLQAERILRPVATAALAEGVTEVHHVRTAGTRIVLAWSLGTGIPVLGLLLVVASQKMGLTSADVGSLRNAVIALALSALLCGFLAIKLVASAIGDPIRSLTEAQRKVREGDLNTTVHVYDASDLGMLQTGFNDMVRDLRERQELRDLFGRYVGEDVARRALERGTELGGEERGIAVLFVDLVGSTHLASTNSPDTVVALLNDFFREIVDVVGRNGGFVNKFLGDAALAIFGAPLEHPDAPGGALAAARELRERLDVVLGPGEYGIGVSAGRAVAGHVGAAARFEFTVIGDPVNEAARLTELAKHEPGGVLASAVTIQSARDVEAFQWEVDETVQLRGRALPTQLARPIAIVRTDRGGPVPA